MTAGTSIRILIVEDHEIMRFGLKSMLKELPSVEVVGEAADGNTAVELASTLTPDVILMDIGLPGIDGVEATREVKKRNSEINVIMFTSFDNEKSIFAALAAGADGYCVKNIARDQLITAIQSVTSGCAWLDPSIAGHVLKVCDIPDEDGATKPAPNKVKLTARELDVLKLVVEGLTNQQIADRLILGVETVKTHMRHIMEKLSVSDRTQAAVKAMREGLL